MDVSNKESRRHSENLLNHSERWILAALTQSSADGANSDLLVFRTLHTFFQHWGLITLSVHSIKALFVDTNSLQKPFVMLSSIASTFSV